MDYTKLHWECDYVSTEIYGEGIDEYVVGVYTLKDFPNIMIYINTEINQIIDVYLSSEFYIYD